MANSFIHISKLPEGASILFSRKPNGNPRLYINYQKLNNLTNKNWYPLSLINKSLDWLCSAKQITQLNFMGAYHQIRIKEGNE